MALTNSQVYKIGATSANGLVGGIALHTKQFRNVDFQIYTPAGSSFVIKFVVSMQEACPDFTVASSATNLWSYAQEVNLDNGNPVTGSTGVTIVGETSLGGEINANNGSTCWVGMILSSYAAGSVSGVYDLSTNA